MALNTLELSEAAFQPFGKVLRLPERKPDATGAVHEYWDQLVVFPGETSVNFLITKQRDPIFTEMERHRATAEILVLLAGSCLLPVAPAGPLDEAAIRVFQMKPGDAVCMEPGTWHWLPFPREQASQFLVVYHNGTAQHDLEYAPLREAKQIVAPLP